MLRALSARLIGLDTRMQVMQDCSTHDMVFSVAEVISFLSQVCLERLSLSCRALVFVSLVFVFPRALVFVLPGGDPLGIAGMLAGAEKGRGIRVRGWYEGISCLRVGG